MGVKEGMFGVMVLDAVGQVGKREVRVEIVSRGRVRYSVYILLCYLGC